MSLHTCPLTYQDVYRTVFFYGVVFVFIFGCHPNSDGLKRENENRDLPSLIVFSHY